MPVKALLLAASLVAASALAISPALTVRWPDGGYGIGVAPLPDGGVPGGAGVVTDTSSATCYCANGLPATVPNPDGGAFPVVAPQGVTLRSCTGTGCSVKACTVLFIGDPTSDESWPGDVACPGRPARPDGGRGPPVLTLPGFSPSGPLR